MVSSQYIKEYCTGCGMCHSVLGTELHDNEKKFPIAKIDNNQNMHFFEAVCPVYYYADEAKHDVWGIVDRALIGYSSDKDIRYKAASGGALTEICSYLLENRIVDGILQTKYDPEDQTKNISVVSTTVEQVEACCGSRYSISVPLHDILQSIEKGKKYAFVGKPCDVMALRRYMDVNPNMQNSITILLSFFCAGEPSVEAQNSLLARMNCQHDECASITYRGNGWPGYTTVQKKDGTVEKLEYQVTWGQYLGRDIRNICRFCMDGTGDAADIVCADFWYLDKEEKPDFSEHEGRNIIITRNAIATEIVMASIHNGRITLESDFTSSMDEFHKYQPAQYKRKGTMKSMISAMRLCGRPVPKYSKSYLQGYSAHLEGKVKLKYFVGIIKRVIRGRL